MVDGSIAGSPYFFLAFGRSASGEFDKTRSKHLLSNHEPLDGANRERTCAMIEAR